MDVDAAIDAKLAAEGILPPADRWNSESGPRYVKTADRLLERGIPFADAHQERRTLRPGAPRTIGADLIFDEGPQDRQRERLQYLRQIQTFIDKVDTQISQVKLAGFEERYQDQGDKELGVRKFVDSWQDEQPEKLSDIKFKYKTPMPHNPVIDLYGGLLRDMRDLWVGVDLDLQARGWRPAGKDKNQYVPERGFRPVALGGKQTDKRNIREAFPELFGQKEPLKSRRGATKSATKDGWLDKLMSQIEGRRVGTG